MINFENIGTIQTPFETREGMPIQSNGAKGIKGKIILNEEYSMGLKDLDGFSHIILIYHFHKSDGFDLQTTPFLDTKPRGVFATRAPRRPNPIGISVVKLVNIENNILHVKNVDMLNGTPLLDIKPFIASFDIHPSDKSGWIGNKDRDLNKIKSDTRFI